MVRGKFITASDNKLHLGDYALFLHFFLKLYKAFFFDKALRVSLTDFASGNIFATSGSSIMSFTPS